MSLALQKITAEILVQSISNLARISEIGFSMFPINFKWFGAFFTEISTFKQDVMKMDKDRKIWNSPSGLSFQAMTMRFIGNMHNYKKSNCWKFHVKRWLSCKVMNCRVSKKSNEKKAFEVFYLQFSPEKGT